jgi:hypothetical protein
MEAGYTAPLIPDKVQLPPVNAEPGKLRPQQIGIGPQINQSPQGHIPGDTGVTIKMQGFHVYRTSSG